MPTPHASAGAIIQQSPLLERDDQLVALAAHLAAVLGGGGGRMVFIGGEAGVGKSALARRFASDHVSDARLLTGMCDPLYTPRPLGPLLDIAPALGDRFQALVEGGGRAYEIAMALIGALAHERPTILLFEDVHWADEATLDVLRFLARRIESVPALILMTYRDDLERIHPLRILLGELPPGPSIARMRPAPLSQEAVATLAEPDGVDAGELFHRTAGNPFFVTEALAAGDVVIPPTVRDAVLARVARLARLAPAALALLEAVAIVPLQVEFWLLDALAGAELAHLDACLDTCLDAGMLAASDGAVRFRHELARLAIADAISPIRRATLHRRALHALEQPPAGEPDLARIIHHAEAAADRAAILRYAPAAAALAASLGAHREAAAYYTLALQGADDLPPLERGQLSMRHAHEAFLNDHFPITTISGRRAIESFHAAGEREWEGQAMRELSSHLRCIGLVEQAQEMGEQAVKLLEQMTPGRELAMAYANLACLGLNADDAAAVVPFAQRAYALASDLGDVETQLHALNTLGTMRLLLGEDEGLENVQASLELALAAGLEEHVGRAYLNIEWALTRTRSYAQFERYFAAGRAYCAEHGLILWIHYVLAYAARWALDQGRLSEAIELAQQVIGDPRTSLPHIPPLVALALIRARRGDPEVWPLLDEALALAEPTGELQNIAPVAAARAEVAWLEGRPDAVRAETEAALAMAVRNRAPWLVGELACWRWRAGIATPAEGAAEPYAREMAGDWQAAARLWEQRGCSYEAALARAEANDEAALRDALATLQRLGAQTTARIVTRKLRRLGAHDLPRGPRASTQASDALLTAREREVLALICQGLRNADIASRLYLAPKTVEHHISAILAKLQARSRAEAVAVAHARGLIPADARL
ncbi:MAG TPA: AAA family ATPase [Ktedonobacterales bacterium]|jgi:DNA-binding CsgD family transcriptional regulator